MIRIVKPREAPGNLVENGTEQTRRDCEDYDRCPSEYRSDAKRTIYAAAPVKQALLEAHYYKCCYCETKYLARANLAVEHFRPKNAVKQAPDQEEEYPGYYWLAYDWDNLLLSCHQCNTSHKKTLFPLANPEERARSHHDDISIEQPLFINPAWEDPRDHLRFRNEAPEGLTDIGRLMIKEIGLRRTQLREDRKKVIDVLRNYCEFIEYAKRYPDDSQMQEKARELLEYLNSAIRPEAEYSSMAIDFLDNWQP